MSEFSEARYAVTKLADAPRTDAPRSSLNALKETRDEQESGAPVINDLDSCLRACSPASAYEFLRPVSYRLFGERGTTVAGFQRPLEASGVRLVKIAIKTNGKILFFDPAELFAVEAHGNRVLVRRKSESYVVSQPIATMEAKLKHYGFLRIHRSMLVNAIFVEEIRPLTTGEYVLRIKGGKEFSVSRKYKKNLKSLARSWIGTTRSCGN
jgi:DNA-binding LytR/AlgR family response regulator